MTKPRLNIDTSLEAVRARAVARANLRVDEMQRQLWRDGRADRAAMGNPDPTLADTFRAIGANFAKVLGLGRR